MTAPEIRPIEWRGDAESGALFLLDQRLLPAREEWRAIRTVADLAQAITTMVVRGAPAIGVAAAYGIVIAAQEARRLRLDDRGARDHIDKASKVLLASRPTAVNLAWALAECWPPSPVDAAPARLLEQARQLHEEDVENNRRMAAVGASRIEVGMGVLTHCNAGALATGGVGTALGVIARAHADGKRIHVFVDETRPRLQGARLTAWELSRLGVPYTLICDNMSASLMARGKIQFCVAGADRIAANGDTANKIGTYGVAVLAKHHGLPFHIAAPRSTFDLSIPDGAGIPIEERSPDEVTAWGSERTCPDGAQVFNPAFDVTPGSLIRSFFTECGEVQPVRQLIADTFRSASAPVV